MPLIVVTAPTAEPLDLIEAKAHLRVDIADDDLLIQSMLSAARDYAENFTQKQFVAARLKQVMDAFPAGCADYGSTGGSYSRPGNAIYLERSPVVRVVSIQYLDQQQVTQTVDPTTYVVDYSSDPVRITPVFGQIWPIPIPQIASVWVIFDAGYAAPITIDTVANTVAVTGWPALAVNAAVRFSASGGGLPARLQTQTDYYVQAVISAGVYTLATTPGGAVIDIQDKGLGTSYMGVVPEGIKGWLKIRLGALYENREEEVIASRITVASLSFVDRMLDGYKTYRF